MSAHESGGISSIGRTTRKGILRHFDDISQAAFVQLLIRAAVIAPLIFCESMGGPAPDLAAVGASLAIYVFLLIPLRFWAKQKVRRAYYKHSSSGKKQTGVYGKWLATGLLRYFRGILWGLPFIACAVYFTVFRTILDAQTFEMPVHWLAMLLAGNPESSAGNVNLAVGLIAAAVALFGLLFAYGWWRDLPFEYLPVRSIGPADTLEWSLHILRQHRKKMRANTFVNFLLSLPGALGFGAVLGMYAMDSVNFSYGITVTISQIRRLFTQPLPRLVLLQLLGVFAVLYLPLCIYRKCRNAALMAKLLRHKHAHSAPAEAEQAAYEPLPEAGTQEPLTAEGQDQA